MALGISPPPPLVASFRRENLASPGVQMNPGVPTAYPEYNDSSKCSVRPGPWLERDSFSVMNSPSILGVV
ncbi:hypothetical protein BD413DRAFT_512376 [Trametes elegans]|nr:hypothetical protein BD413DRAFT_512376 [Trametes elegans]